MVCLTGLPPRRPANQPKPNTRFLNNIIRNTNSHNRALQAKESAESKAKLRDLEDAEEKKRMEEERKLRKARPGPGDTRKRMLGDIAAILGGSSKKRKTEEADFPTSNASRYAKRRTEASCSRPRNDSALNSDDEDSKRDRRKNRSGESSRASRHTYRREHEDREGESSSSHSRRKHRDRSPRRKSESSRRHRRSSVAKRPERESSRSRDLSDSDPLDDIIGPAPASTPDIRRRGRGANSTTSGIDGRFAADYDPKRDVTPEPDDADDWDRAAEAFRDRQKWKQQGADRLRSAGFTEEQVQKWENSDQQDEADVKWIKAGTEREWDRGKVAGENGLSNPAADAE